jgi:predicted Fe-Mo cluster-binding NifX family protein
MAKIAFASDENRGLESSLAYHFGRCPYYVFAEIREGHINTVETKGNPYYDNHVPGAVPQFIAECGAEVMIAGGMGPRALNLFRQLGIQPITGVSGKVKDALNSYLAGLLKGAEPCDDHKSHY